MSIPLSPSRASARWSLAAGYTLAGTSALSGRLLLDGLPGSAATLLTLVLGALVLVPPALVRGLPRIRVLVRALPSLALQALFGTVLFRVFLLAGLGFTSASAAGLVTSLVPAATAVLARVLLGERGEARGQAALALAAAGLVLVNLPAPGTQPDGGAWAGNFLVAAAVGCEAAFTVLSRGHGTSLDPGIRALAVLALAALLCVPWVAFEGAWGALAAPAAWPWGPLVWSGAFVSGLSYLLFYRGVAVLPAREAAVLGGLVPLVGTAAPVLVLGEPLTLPVAAGALLVAAGILVQSRRPVP